MSDNKKYPDMPQIFHARVVDTLEHLEDRTVERKHRKLIHAGTAVAAVLGVCLISVGAYAVVNGVSPKLAELFGMDETAQQQVLDQHMIAESVASATDGELTVRVEQTIGDAQSAYILLALKSDNQEMLDEASFFDKVDVDVRGVDINMGAGMVDDSLQDEDGNAILDENGDFIFKPRENGVRYYEVQIRTANKKDTLLDKTVSVKLKNLCNDTGKLQGDVICKGAWNLSWKLNYEEVRQTWTPDATIELLDATFTLRSFEMTSLSFNAVFEGEALARLNTAYGEEGFGLNLFVTGLLMDDGTVQERHVSVNSFGFQDETQQVYRTTGSFDEIMDGSHVVGVRVSITNYNNGAPECPYYDCYFA